MIDEILAFDHRLYTFALSKLRDPQLAEECKQETLLSAWKNQARFNPEKASLKTWLFAICQRRAIDILRKQRRECRSVQIDVDPEDRRWRPNVDDAELWAVVEDRASRLRGKDAEVWEVMKSGEPLRDAEKRLGIPRATLSWRRKKILDRFRAGAK